MLQARHRCPASLHPPLPVVSPPQNSGQHVYTACMHNILGRRQHHKVCAHGPSACRCSPHPAHRAASGPCGMCPHEGIATCFLPVRNFWHEPLILHACRHRHPPRRHAALRPQPSGEAVWGGAHQGKRSAQLCADGSKVPCHALMVNKFWGSSAVAEQGALGLFIPCGRKGACSDNLFHPSAATVSSVRWVGGEACSAWPCCA